ncbi:MAG: cobyric acid synthase [Acidobacteriota bacterium]
MLAKALMVGGTASGVGKSWMTTAICAWLRRRGVRVAPFKAQNMSNNSYPCSGGGEIGRAQVAQAEACGLEPTVDMNPILLKPTGDTGSQVVVQGKVWRNLQAREYYDYFDYLLSKVEESYHRLASQYDFIVMEGAGSIAEINLRRTDLVNLGLATRLNVPVLLVADIDRGGVFASVYGTLALLPPNEASLVRAFAVNRFRGDPSLFANGVAMLQERTERPCLGVFPYTREIQLDEEDGVMFDTWQPKPKGAPSIAILEFPHVSNITDFRLLTWANRVHRPVRSQFDVVILPGSKNTIADLNWMRAQGLDLWVHQQHANGARVIGICGGYQILGDRIDDPFEMESGQRSASGLGLLPVTTTLLREKVTQSVTATTLNGHRFSAYEIHMGQTVASSQLEPFANVEGRNEGVQLGTVSGTYLHGALEDPGVVEEWLGFRPPVTASKQQSYEQIADWFEQSADTGLFEKLFLTDSDS